MVGKKKYREGRKGGEIFLKKLLLTAFKISNPSVTRLSPTKGASASAPAEEKVNKNIQNYSHRNVPTVVSSARSSFHCSVAANSHDRQDDHN